MPGLSTCSIALSICFAQQPHIFYKKDFASAKLGRRDGRSTEFEVVTSHCATKVYPFLVCFLKNMMFCFSILDRLEAHSARRSIAHLLTDLALSS